MNFFGGMKVIVDPNALAETTERNFPASRHRSKRIHKKLVKRFHGEFRKEPAIFKWGSFTLVVHPAMYEKIKHSIDSR